ncbi:hypothetical protein B488_09210 [Liberibacter crescens BT-1]|uniref:DUF1007 family protein n=2 Tax=Liberibacter crescens TaxID=1273132 RepID=L0EW76_LIBCB|nr:hypothetical protein B488_09210 [Liberibacter crescens BT-1]AMC12940.1 ABC transporter substrate-binding protein [Liberibacter crescens]
MIYLKIIIITMFSLISLSTKVLSHPHIFIEAHLEVAVSPDDNKLELRNVWRFDEMFTSSVIIDFDKSGNLRLDPDELAEVSKTIRESLAEYDYYITATVDGQKMIINKPDIINSDIQNNRLIMIFSIKLNKTAPLSGKFVFRLCDPTLYTSISFIDDKDLIAVGNHFSKCNHKVVRPNPDEVIAENKSTLTDAFFNDPTGTNMQKLFATRLEMTCL